MIGDLILLIKRLWKQNTCIHEYKVKHCGLDYHYLPEDNPKVQEYITKMNTGLWLARSVDGTLLCHTCKPACKAGYWYSTYMMIVDPEWYPEVTFENSPKKLKL